MAQLRVRWSEFEARKPYARPFMVSFASDDGREAGSVAVNGADLLYYHQFQVAVLALGGELFSDPDAQRAPDSQRAWLDRLAGLLPPAGAVEVLPESSFDEHRGRIFRCVARLDGGGAATVDAASLFEYQELQAAIAHQTGRLFRDPGIESVDEPSARHDAWMATLQAIVRRPLPAEMMSEAWPWR